MLKKHSATLLIFFGLFLALGSIITVAILDRPLAGRQLVTFVASTGDSLVGAYYPGVEPVGVILMAVLGSLSGMIGGLQGLLILWLVLAFGNLVQAVGRRPWLTALCMAALLYWFILPQGVLF